MAAITHGDIFTNNCMVWARRGEGKDSEAGVSQRRRVSVDKMVIKQITATVKRLRLFYPGVIVEYDDEDEWLMLSGKAPYPSRMARLITLKLIGQKYIDNVNLARSPRRRRPRKNACHHKTTQGSKRNILKRDRDASSSSEDNDSDMPPEKMARGESGDTEDDDEYVIEPYLAFARPPEMFATGKSKDDDCTIDPFTSPSYKFTPDTRESYEDLLEQYYKIPVSPWLEYSTRFRRIKRRLAGAVLQDSRVTLALNTTSDTDKSYEDLLEQYYEIPMSPWL